MDDETGCDSVHERQRAEIAARIPAGYRPWVHLTIPSAIGLSILALALGQIHALAPRELLTVPITLLAGFGFEWRAHKDILHRRLPLLGILYERHELAHHVIYTRRDLSMRSRREWFLVLMPPYAIVLVFAMVVPIALGTAYFATKNSAMLMIATSMFFFLSYEWLHLIYHLSDTSPLRRLPLIPMLREQHRRHHEPRLMKRWNFNVTVPVFDVIHGTLWSPEREERRARRDERRARRRRAAASP
jgi:sterol desaturase/sphingolipid hydroxylase (fatty acid hydroxylase superfamily)